MKMTKCMKKGFFLALAAGLLLTGKALTVEAADKVPLTADVFKDANVLEAVSQYDTNGNGYLDKSELMSINSLSIYGNVADISGLERLTSLNRLYLNYEGANIKLGKNVTNLNLRMYASSICIDAPGAVEITVMTDLTSSYDPETDDFVTIQTSCETVDVSKCSGLRNLNLWANGLTSFQLPKNGGNIKELRIRNSNLKTLKVPAAKKLTYLSVCEDETITSVDPRNAPNLGTLYLVDNPQLKSLYLNKNKKLSRLICGNTAIDKLDISGNTNLGFLSCPNNKLTSLDCSKNAKLTAVQCYDNKLTSLNVKKAVRVEEVSCANNKIKSLDLSQNQRLKTVLCYGNPLKSLYVKGKTNVLKKVSIAPVIDSVKLDDQHILSVKMKKNNKIKDYYVLAIPEGKVYFNYRIKKSGLTYSLDCLSEGMTYDVQVAAGVACNDVTVYAKDTVYKEKVIVESY